MKKILAPHKEQDGFVYVRVPSGITKPDAEPRFDVPRPLVVKALIIEDGEAFIEHHYNDSEPGSRIISSRRVEEAVETADFLKLCDEEGLHASFWGHNSFSPWIISDVAGIEDTISSGTTIREAYYRYKAQAGDAL